MCSDMCPCDNDSFADGGYLSLSELDYETFGRSAFSTGGSYDDAMMFTRDNLDDWLDT